MKQTQCPYCSIQCTFHMVQEEHFYRASPNKQDPVVHGKWCAKGMHAHVPVLGEERLQTPLLRQKGKLVPVSWETALHWFQANVRRIQQEHGKDAVGVYGGGSLTNENAYLLGKFARVALGTRYIDYNGRYCMSSAAAAANQTFGIDRGFTNPLSDLPHAQCILLAGTNIAECQPTLMPYLLQAKANGATLITIDPRKTNTTKIAHRHLSIRPGSDAALVNGLLKTIVEEGYVDWEFAQAHVDGYEAVVTHVRNICWTEVERITGLPKEDIQQVARTFGQAATGFILTARGVEQQPNGVMNVRNYLNLLLLTGNIGKKGAGYGAVTGQGNGQGGREHGQKADQLPGYRHIDHPDHRRHIADIWGIPESELPEKGVSAYEMFDKILEGDIQSLIVFASNPVVSSPHVHRVKAALRQLKGLVVVDLFLSETAQMADLVLPGSSHLEDTGTITTLEGRVTLREAVIPSLPGTKQDWEIMQEMAHALGKEKGFRFVNSEEIFEELRRASQGGVADYSGISYQRIRQEQGVFWPCPSENDPGRKRLFEDRCFYHTDGKARLVPVAHTQPQEQLDRQYPLVLTTGRITQHYLTGVQTRRTPALLQKASEPFVQMHPATAEKWGVKDGEIVRITSRRGTVELRVQCTDSIREDTVFVPFHWGEEQCINRLTSPLLDPASRMPAFKYCAVRIEPAEAASHKTKELAEISS
ncbi:assimilatory nitrate reductase catalytic subunit [Marinithermofilum abyssi]|uniref:Assimilatory nitrate reductase catalytic subunit n=1 Tax=Marinithermofilum abyssi TaxID=1571185 RepID=A0A8J2VFD1_9BACL|nr:molybdopterin oxidoreductase family protein [Marinithermofilum abyssi]GGE07636.1 assimilatory nitrate reductase catalytic subunit [Marinithermofilum abyssi]